MAGGLQKWPGAWQGKEQIWGVEEALELYMIGIEDTKVFIGICIKDKREGSLLKTENFM